MRTQYPSITEATQQILREVEAENRVKTAEQQILRQTLAPQVRTEEAHEIMKLAAACRDIDESNPDVSYGDLQTFMAQVNAK